LYLIILWIEEILHHLVDGLFPLFSVFHSYQQLPTFWISSAVFLAADRGKGWVSKMGSEALSGTSDEECCDRPSSNGEIRESANIS
jgi:hypothetical protein